MHVWRACLDLPTVRIQRLRQTLSADELSRVARFKFPADRRRFIASRGLLRAILGRYLSVPPGQLRFSYGPFGKPALVAPLHLDPIDFNLSHSGDLAFYAFVRDRRMGVDLERLSKEVDCESMAERFFSPGEREVWRALPPGARQEAFFTCWTRKEAYLKATGAGLSLELDRFSVSLAPGEPPALLETLDDPQDVDRWSLHDLSAGPGYAAALAAEGRTLRLCYWDVTWDGYSIRQG